MLKKVLLGLLAAFVLAVVVLAILIAVQPATYKVVRSATVAAPPAEVFAKVNDFRAWESWSPWAKLDPAVRNTFEGPPGGAGSVFKWAGNDKVGEGKMTLTESRPGERIRIKLEFIKPFASVCDTGFDFAPAPNGTLVTWTMSGDNDFLGKAFCLFMGGMDKAVGPDFERGLAQMQATMEKK
ncbi:MAG: SRPBCC family protein [Acidobacteria bacterium]|nr:SRPBCC family protein [Acidobacteriota bacterium]